METFAEYIRKQPCHIYFLYRDDELLYIGGSTNINVRIQVHNSVCQIPFDRYEVMEVEYDKLWETEARLIKKHQPPYNYLHTDREFERPASPVDLGELEGVV
jgi:hypothetical protein